MATAIRIGNPASWKKALRVLEQTVLLQAATTSDTVTGLALGGDDYVTKPFSVEALVARVRAVLRRTARQPSADGEEGLLTADDLARVPGRVLGAVGHVSAPS